MLCPQSIGGGTSMVGDGRDCTDGSAIVSDGVGVGVDAGLQPAATNPSAKTANEMRSPRVRIETRA